MQQGPTEKEIDDSIMMFIWFCSICIKAFRINHFSKIESFLGDRTESYKEEHIKVLKAKYKIKINALNNVDDDQVIDDSEEAEPFKTQQPPSENEIDDLIMMFIWFTTMCKKTFRTNHFSKIEAFLGDRTESYKEEHIKLLNTKYQDRLASKKKGSSEPSKKKAKLN